MTYGGATIDDDLIDFSGSYLLGSIGQQLRRLRGETNKAQYNYPELLTNEEKKYLDCIKFCFAVKYSSVAFKPLKSLLSFITFHGIIPGMRSPLTRRYGLGLGLVLSGQTGPLCHAHLAPALRFVCRVRRLRTDACDMILTHDSTRVLCRSSR